MKYYEINLYLISKHHFQEYKKENNSFIFYENLDREREIELRLEHLKNRESMEKEIPDEEIENYLQKPISEVLKEIEEIENRINNFEEGYYWHKHKTAGIVEICKVEKDENGILQLWSLGWDIPSILYLFIDSHIFLKISSPDKSEWDKILHSKNL